MKYDNMLRRNKAVSMEKVRRAQQEICKLLDEQKPVTVSTLAKNTGLSREFFYKNMEVRACLMAAREKQEGMVFQRPRKTVIDKALAMSLEETQKTLQKVREENRRLQRENDKLRKALKRRDLALIRSL